jgi:hypothetical protein
MSRLALVRSVALSGAGRAAKFECLFQAIEYSETGER